MTPEQRATLNWMRRSRPEAGLAQQAIVVQLGSGQGYATAVIYPDGAYCVATLGGEHEPPSRTRRVS